jgi:hypothetical protein
MKSHITFNDCVVYLLMLIASVFIVNTIKLNTAVKNLELRNKLIISNAIRMGYITNNNGKLDWRLQKECQDCGGTVSE